MVLAEDDELVDVDPPADLGDDDPDRVATGAGEGMTRGARFGGTVGTGSGARARPKRSDMIIPGSPETLVSIGFRNTS